MTSSVSGAWWPRSAGSMKEDSTENTRAQRDNDVQSPAQEPRSYLSFMPWSAGSDYEAQNSQEEGNSPALNPTSDEEPPTWWSTIVGTTNFALGDRGAAETQHSNKPVTSASHKNIHKEQHESTTTRSWFSWQFFSNTEDTISESDTEDKRDLEAFREAKALVESCKDTCHYAVFKNYASNDLFLAVHGTSTENSPVKFNEKKQPIMPHQHFEKAISNFQNTKPVETVYGDQSRLSRKPSVSGNAPSSSSRVENQPQRANNTSTQNFGIPVLRSQNGVADSSVNSGSSNNSDFSDSLSPRIESNLRVITVSTKLRLWSEAIIHKEMTSERHVYRSTHNSVERKRKKLTKRALIVSVHSFLPTKFVRSYISRNSGSACDMAEKAMDAVSRWAAKGDIHDLQIQSIALEGIGTIESRKERSIQLLKNWESDLKSSDFIFFVANSTSSIVVTQILQSMLRDSALEFAQKKIGFLSISGAFHGPVVGLDAKVIRRAYSSGEYDIIKELFELQKVNSDLNKTTKDSFNDICRSNVKLAMVGSTDDSFIPLHSSVSHQMSHPNLFKSIHCDENTEIPKFIRDLFSIILTMENVGLVDHFQLLRDLSDLSQGFISSNTPHMEIYKSSEVYDVGVQFAAETTSLKLQKDITFNQSTTHGSEAERNLYHLPWNVRGLIDTLLKIKHVKSMKLLKDVVVDYQNWLPSTRLGQEVKQCFAAFEDANPEDLLL